ncbi:hypothetical protein JCM3770_002845 [Rhodotorula araucariae]
MPCSTACSPLTALSPRLPLPPFPHIKRANDGFWTPSMGDSSPSAATAAALPVYNPKAAASPVTDDFKVVTLTSIVKIVQPVTVTELVAKASSTRVVAASPDPSPATILPSARLFSGASSSAFVPVLGAAASAPSFIVTTTSAPVVGATAVVLSVPPPSVDAAPVTSTSSAERVFSPPTRSQVRAAVAALTWAELQPATPSASNSTLPEATRSASAFSHIGDSPGNIALTALICLAILAALLTAPVFLLCRRQRRQRRARHGQVALGGETGSPGGAAGWSPVTPAANWSPASEERWSSADLGDGVRDMRELWRESALRQAGTVDSAAEVYSPASSWTSFVGGYPSTDGHGNLGLFDNPFRRTSDTTVGSDILDWGRRRPSGAAARTRPPHPLRIATRPDDLSPSLYSGSNGQPVSPRSPFYSPHGHVWPFVRGEELESVRRAPDLQLRNKTSWREGLDRVMSSAADLITASLLSRDPSVMGSRRGSLARSFVGLRRKLVRGYDEEQGEKAPPSEVGGDEKTADFTFTLPGGSGSSVSSNLLNVNRPLTPSSPILGYAPAAGAMGLLVPPRPGHIRAASSSSYYSPRPLPTSSFALPPSAFDAGNELAYVADRRDVGPFSPSPAVPPCTPPSQQDPEFAPLQPSPAPFSRLEPVSPSSPPDPFADPSPAHAVAPPSSPFDAMRSPPSMCGHEQEASRCGGDDMSNDGDDDEETLSELAHHAAFAQLHLLRRLGARRASSSAPSRTGTSSPCVVARGGEAHEGEADDNDDSPELSSSSSSSSPSAVRDGDMGGRETPAERQARRVRVARERGSAAVLIRERRRRSLLGQGQGQGSWRVSSAESLKE